MRDNRRGAEITMQSMPDVLGRWHRYCTCGHFLRDDTTENKKYISSVLDLFAFPELLHQEGPATRSQVREERRLQRIPHGKTTSKEVSKETIRKYSRSIYP